MKIIFIDIVIYADEAFAIDGHGIEICGQRLSFPDALLRYRERCCECVDYAEVSAWLSWLCFEIVEIATDCLCCSSVVLWVSQNMEDDYTYNLAL